MTRSEDALLAEVLKLPEAERGRIAERILESLDPRGGDWDATWEAEIGRRVEEVRDGTVRLVPWNEALGLILRDSDDPGTT